MHSSVLIITIVGWLQLSFGYECLWAISANLVYSFSYALLVLHMCLSIIVFTTVVRDLSVANSDSVYMSSFADLTLHNVCAN